MVYGSGAVLHVAGGEANFADLAAQYSQGPEAKTKGLWDRCLCDRPIPPSANGCAQANLDNCWNPNIEQWWLVARLERYEAARFDATTAEQMTTELFEEWVQEEMLCRMSQHD